MVGDIINVKGTNLLVLDERDRNPFVIALDLNIETEFSKNCNNYDGSIVEYETKAWIQQFNIPIIERELDLITLDGYKDYGKKIVGAAPLTLREYQDYSDIIIPHIKNWFWLATGGSRPSRTGKSSAVLCIDKSGRVVIDSYNYIASLVPAFILDKAKLKFMNGDNLKEVPTEALVAELARRFN